MVAPVPQQPNPDIATAPTAPASPVEVLTSPRGHATPPICLISYPRILRHHDLEHEGHREDSHMHRTRQHQTRYVQNLGKHFEFLRSLSWFFNMFSFRCVCEVNHGSVQYSKTFHEFSVFRVVLVVNTEKCDVEKLAIRLCTRREIRTTEWTAHEWQHVDLLRL